MLWVLIIITLIKIFQYAPTATVFMKKQAKDFLIAFIVCHSKLVDRFTKDSKDSAGKKEEEEEEESLFCKYRPIGP